MIEGTSVGFIGAGNMASALIRGMVKAPAAPASLWAFDIDRTKAETLAAEMGAHVAASIDQLVAECDVIFIAVKPKLVIEVIQDRPGVGPLWISIAAGVTTTQIEEAFTGPARVVRSMPNTPALVGEGATGICAGAHLRSEDLALAEQLLHAVGKVVVVEESMMDAVTGLSGSGPAFVMMMVEALADGGVRAGLPRELAHRLATQTVVGSAMLIEKSGKHPAQLKDMVTSPGGTTITGVQVLEERGLRAALIEAVFAAAQRSHELSRK